MLRTSLSRHLVVLGTRQAPLRSALLAPISRASVRPFSVCSPVFAAHDIASHVNPAAEKTSGSFQAEKVEVIHGSIPRLTLPLSSGEKCAFPLRLNETVRDLVLDIREEERNAKEILFLDENSKRIAHSTRIEDLIKTPFVIAVDSNRYYVDARIDPTLHFASVLGNAEIQDLTLKAYYKKIRERLQNENHHHMPYAEYLAWCNEYGLTEQQARELSKALHMTGEILHFPENEKLKDYIFLQPAVITEAVIDQLDLKYIKKNTNQLRSELEDILPKYLKINAIKKELDAKAERKAKTVMWLGGGYLVTQFSVLAHMVWIDFNWDIMEPISYFVGLATMMVSVLFFSLYRTEYTYHALKDRQRLKALRKLYISREFNWQKWNALDQKVKHYRKLLGEANIPEELKKA